MRLKSFYATTMNEAMQMVRETLGDDAVIVATQEERGGNIHVTAAIEPHFELSGTGASSEWLQYDDEDEENAIAEALTDALLRHSAPEDVMDNIISCASVVGIDDPGAALVASVEHLFHFRPLPSRASDAPILLAGMPGAGKTLAAAKLATRGVMSGLNVGVISCDTVRAGGVEQLKAFTDLLEVPLHRADSATDLRALLANEMRAYDQVIIDTPGMNPFDKDDVRMLATLLGAGAQGTELAGYMILPGGTDTDEASEAARVFSTVGVQGLLPTRIDIARRLGGVLSAAHSGNLAFSDASNTPKVAEGLMALTPESLSRFIMPTAFRRAPAHHRNTGKQRQTA